MRPLLCVLVCLFTGGCVGPRPEAPASAAVNPPPAWRTGALGDAPIEKHWWNRFGDPALAELVERARTHNAELGIASARVAEALAGFKAADGSRKPEIDLVGGASYARTVTLGIPVTAFGAQGQMAATWDADLFGRLRNSAEAARLALLATRAGRDAVVLGLESTVVEVYLALRGADMRLAIVRETIAVRQASLELVRRLHASGYASDLDLAQAEGEYRATSQLLPSTLLSIAKLEHALSNLIGDAPREIARPSSGLEGLTIPAVPTGLPSSLLRRRPDIVAAEDTLVASDRSLDSARAALMPDFSLGAAGGGVTADVLPRAFTIFTLGANAFAPLIDFGRRQAGADAAAARRDRAAYEYRTTVLTAFREVENGLATVKRLDEQIIELTAQVTAETQAFRIAKMRYEAGYDSFLNQLDVQRRLLVARLSLNETETARLSAYVGLFRSLGGGWTSQ